MRRAAAILLSLLVVGGVSGVLANELIGGVWSTSQLYPYVIRPADEPEVDPNVYEFARLQIVHDERIGSPIRLVRASAGGGGEVVVYDRGVGPDWDDGGIGPMLDEAYPQVPAETRGAWAEAMQRQIGVARDAGAQAAQQGTFDVYGEAYLMFLYGDGAPPLSDQAFADAAVLAGAPSTQVWYVNLLGLVLVWGGLFAVLSIVIVRLRQVWSERGMGR